MNDPLLKQSINIDELTLLHDLAFPYIDVLLEEYFSLDKATSESLIMDKATNLSLLAQKTHIEKKELMVDVKKLVQLSQAIIVNNEFILKNIEQTSWSKDSIVFFHLAKNDQLKVQLPFNPIVLDFFSFARGDWLKNLKQYKAIFFYCTSDRRSFSAALSLRKSGVLSSFALI
jgi:rhodanese-related sulfurtransferase